VSARTRPDLYARADETRTADGGRIDSLPAFALGYSLDDLARPSEVTVFDERDWSMLDVRWITVDADHAVPLEACR